MRDDLLDAKAAIDWAVAQLPVLEDRIESWRRNEPCTIRIDTDSEPGKKLYRFANIKPIDPMINAEAGAIIHSIRSSLDLLACTLAERNGHPDSTDTYFPIWKSKEAFDAPAGREGNPVLRHIKRLSEVDQVAIKKLKPYPGENDLLVALHELDKTRKHRRLLNAFQFPRGIGVAPRDGRSVTWHVGQWCGFNEESVLIWTDATASDCDVRIGVFVAMDEAGPLHGENFTATIRKFAGLAEQIVCLFDN